jgi:hypothetical protein
MPATTAGVTDNHEWTRQKLYQGKCKDNTGAKFSGFFEKPSVRIVTQKRGMRSANICGSMNSCPNCGKPVRANGSSWKCDYCSWPRNESRKLLASPPLSLLTDRKRCRKCGAEKLLGFFPRDRSRPDGRWHTCTVCRKNRWREHEKPLIELRRRVRLSLRSARSALEGLRRHYGSRRGTVYDSLPAALRRRADMLWSDYVARAREQGRHLSQPQIALMKARAVSNAQRVGDRSWSRRMLRLLGYRRAERRRRFEQETGFTPPHN